jgi:hypothetical protein
MSIEHYNAIINFVAESNDDENGERSAEEGEEKQKGS